MRHAPIRAKDRLQQFWLFEPGAANQSLQETHKASQMCHVLHAALVGVESLGYFKWEASKMSLPCGDRHAIATESMAQKGSRWTIACPC